MEEKQPCHCNGSRGTDCDWCGGSGWKPMVLDVTTFKKKNIGEVGLKLNDNVINSKTIGEPPNTPTKKPKTFEDIIYDIKIEIDNRCFNKTQEDRRYVLNEIFTLRMRLNEIRPFKKKSIAHVNRLKRMTSALFKEFQERM